MKRSGQALIEFAGLILCLFVVCGAITYVAGLNWKRVLCLRRAFELTRLALEDPKEAPTFFDHSVTCKLEILKDKKGVKTQGIFLNSKFKFELPSLENSSWNTDDF